jgi:hypothetical protein
LSSKTFDRRLQAASSALRAQQARIQQDDDQLSIEKLKERGKTLMAAYERKALLASIARGEIEITSKKPCWDNLQKKFVMVPILETPDHQSRIRAISELNRMEGSYAPDKLELSEKRITGMVIEK